MLKNGLSKIFGRQPLKNLYLGLENVKALCPVLSVEICLLLLLDFISYGRTCHRMLYGLMIFVEI